MPGSRWFFRMLLALVFSALPCLATAEPASTLADQLAALEKSAGGRLGLALFEEGGGMRFQYRGRERFPMCSTSKFLIAAAVLQKSRREPGLLQKTVRYRESDLLSYAPVTRSNLATGMPVDALCQAALQVSDTVQGREFLRG